MIGRNKPIPSLGEFAAELASVLEWDGKQSRQAIVTWLGMPAAGKNWSEPLQRLNRLTHAKADAILRGIEAKTGRHPNAAGLYASRVADLVAALNEPEMATDAFEAIRCLIQQIVLTPDHDAQNGLAIDLHGDLALILKLASAQAGLPGGQRPDARSGHGKLPRTSVLGSQLTVVAGTRSHLYRTRLWLP